MNTRLIPTDFGFEIHLRIVDNDSRSPFKQFGTGVGVTMEQHLGRELTPAELKSLATNKYVEIA